MAQDIVEKKHCFACKTFKLLAEFQKNQGRCRPCHSEAMKRSRAKHRAKVLEAQRKYRDSHREKLRESSRRYSASEAGKAKAKQYRNTDRSRFCRAARGTVINAVTSGRIPAARTLSCRDCGEQADSFHHLFGYAREHHLDVIPLCLTCHRIWDRRQSQA